MQSRRLKVFSIFLFVLCSFSLRSHAARLDSSLLRSLLMPGAGQAHKGHYTKAALFASASVISAMGVLVSQVHYNRAVEMYDSERASYISYSKRLDQGEVLRYEDIQETYQSMRESYDQAKRRYKWRNFFLGCLVGSYALNVLDVILSRPSTGQEKTISVETSGDAVRIVRIFRF